MWGLGAIRDGAAGLVKQGAGAVKQGVEAGAKLLENLDEVNQPVTTFDTFLILPVHLDHPWHLTTCSTGLLRSRRWGVFHVSMFL